jgi:hypothetical protein
MSRTKLLPCPFCGRRAKYVYVPNIGLHGIRCPHAGCVIVEVDEPTYEEAVSRWNRRTPAVAQAQNESGQPP